MKEGILRCHPDLAGRMSDMGHLTSESANEQKSAGLLTLTAEEKQYLAKYNALYKVLIKFIFIFSVRTTAFCIYKRVLPADFVFKLYFKPCKQSMSYPNYIPNKCPSYL